MSPPVKLRVPAAPPSPINRLPVEPAPAASVTEPEVREPPAPNRREEFDKLEDPTVTVPIPKSIAEEMAGWLPPLVSINTSSSKTGATPKPQLLPVAHSLSVSPSHMTWENVTAVDTKVMPRIAGENKEYFRGFMRGKGKRGMAYE